MMHALGRPAAALHSFASNWVAPAASAVALPLARVGFSAAGGAGALYAIAKALAPEPFVAPMTGGEWERALQSEWPARAAQGFDERLDRTLGYGVDIAVVTALLLEATQTAASGATRRIRHGAALVLLSLSVADMALVAMAMKAWAGMASPNWWLTSGNDMAAFRPEFERWLPDASTFNLACALGAQAGSAMAWLVLAAVELACERGQPLEANEPQELERIGDDLRERMRALGPAEIHEMRVLLDDLAGGADVAHAIEQPGAVHFEEPVGPHE